MGIRLTSNRLVTIAESMSLFAVMRERQLASAHGEGIFTWIHQILSEWFHTQFHRDLEVKHERIDAFVDCLCELRGHLMNASKRDAGFPAQDMKHWHVFSHLCEIQGRLNHTFNELRANDARFSFTIDREDRYVVKKSGVRRTYIDYRVSFLLNRQCVASISHFALVSFNGMPSEKIDYLPVSFEFKPPEVSSSCSREAQLNTQREMSEALRKQEIESEERIGNLEKAQSAFAAARDTFHASRRGFVNFNRMV